MAPTKSGWRQTIDSWGGFTVIGSLLAAVVVVVILVVVNLPGSDVGGDDWVPQERAQVDGRVVGDPNAPVRIIEFADFQCPFCKAFADDIEPTIYEEFVATGQASFEMHPYSFLGPESFAAAEAAECAADQNRFWDYHDILFARQGVENSGVFSTGNLKDFARELHDVYNDFDLDAFDECVDSGRYESTVEQLRDEASAQGVTSTPSFLVNGRAFPNSTDVETFRSGLQAIVDATTE